MATVGRDRQCANWRRCHPRRRGTASLVALAIGLWAGQSLVAGQAPTTGEGPTADWIVLPQPQEVVRQNGVFELDFEVVLYAPEDLEPPERLAVNELQVAIRRVRGSPLRLVPLENTVPHDGIVLRLDAAADWPTPSPECHRIEINPERVELIARSGPGLFCGIQTLIQTAESCGKRWPCLSIVDYPDFAARGFYHDVTRGKVPTLDTLKLLADRLTRFKINQFQLYVEHVFDFQFNPYIGKGCSPLTADEIRELDAYCRERRIDLVPSLASFGHMGRVLSLPEHRHLAEIETTKRWDEMTWRDRMYGLTLDSTNPESRKLLEQMYGEYLPLFSSKLVNVCADETFDLGKGKNKARAEEEGTGRLYIDHIRWLHDLARRYGKRMMFWGDVVQRHPDLIGEIPKDAILLDWGYAADRDYDQAALFQQAGLETYVCPGCSGWNRFVNGINNAEQNIRRFAAAGTKYGATGLLNTDWGDDGHVNFLACSWHPILLGAAMAWNEGEPSPESFDRSFGFLFFGQRDDRAATALRRAARAGDRVDYWRVFYAPFDDAKEHQRLTREQARQAARAGRAAATLFEEYREQGYGDAQDCAELVWACRMTALTGEKVSLADRLRELGGTSDPELAARFEAFAGELDARANEFETLWLARNKRSNLDDVLAAFRSVSNEAKTTAKRLKEEPFVESPPALFAFLATIVAVIFGLARLPLLKPFFRYFPPLIWTYFVPMICSSLGIIPNTSDLYGPFMGRIVLPMVLVLLLVPSDTRSIARLGPKAVAMMLIGTLGIVAGAGIGFGLVHGKFPEGTWKGVAALAGSWIGGSPNMTAVKESLGADDTLIGKLIVVDTVCAYTWLGVLVALTNFEDKVDRLTRADNTVVQQLAAKLSKRQAERARPITLFDFGAMIGLGLAVSQVCLWGGEHVAGWVEGREAQGGLWEAMNLSQVLSGFGWGILLITAVSVILSLTRVRNIDDAGATPIGYIGLYLLLTTFGARADLRQIRAEDLWLFLMGAVWIATHVVILFAGLRLLRAPLFLGATASMANIGGTASAPVVAAAFHPSLAPVGLVMAILGSVIGTPVALLVIGKMCAAIAGG